ncbi:hypothetical protein LTR66_000338 [Elasticomyces elasticus]|nr:hypothetical protein LTR66_000338 [Elasticomyces elasticus]
MARRRGGRAASAGPTRSGSQTAEAPAGKRRGEKKTEEARVGSRQSKRQRGEPPETALGIPDAKRQKLDAIPEEPEVEGEAETERRADARREIQTAVEPKGKGETAREREPEPVVEPEEEEEPEGAKMSELKGHVEERAKERAEERNLGRQGSISPSPDRHGSPLVASHRQSESDGGSDSEGADEPSSSADEPAPVCLHCIETGGRCDFDINEYPRRPCYECLRYGFANTGKPVFCRILCETCVQHATTLATSMTSQKFEAKKVPAQCRTCTKTLVRESKGRGLCRGCFEGLYPCVFNAKDPTQPCKRCLDKAVLGQEVECRKFCRPCMTIVRNVETGMWTIENITNHLDKGRSKKEIAECLDVVLSPTEWLEKNPAPSGTQLRHNLGVEHKFDEQRDATGIWVRVAVLGAGGYGKAILVMKHNARGVTVDRVVRKEQWIRRMYWTGLRHRCLPKEYLLQRKMSKASSRGTVPVRGVAWNEEESGMFNIYTDYSPHGSLWDLLQIADRDEKGYVHSISQLWAWWTITGPNPERSLQTMLTSYRKPRLPEPFIWYCFANLVDACVVMQQGNEDVKVPDWDQQIVHRDIKPANIVMDASSPGDTVQYPTPKFIDFGFAIETWQDDKHNWTGTGTRGWFAPEQAIGSRMPFLDKTANMQLSAKTNIWAVGMVIYCLINGLVDPPELHFNDKTSDWSGEMPRFRRMPLKFKLNGEACVYSSALARLAYQCLQYDPAARPSPSDLKQQIYSARRDNQMLPHKDWPWKELLEDLKKMDDVWALNEKIEELLKLKNK